MARKVIVRKVRRGAPKKNVLSVRPFGRKLDAKIKKAVNKKNEVRSAKLALSADEKKLLQQKFNQLKEEEEKQKAAVKNSKISAAQPGRVVILLTGPYRGRHAVVLKELESKFLLITGPHVVNGLPLRRVHRKFVITTSTQVDLSKFQLPAHINDKYFAKPVVTAATRKAQQAEADQNQSIFAQRKPEYVLTEQRKQDQIAIDKQVLTAVRAHPEGRLMVQYLASHFYLKNRQYPHKMKF
jgi:large subunit ribosomal protein L6e